MIKIGKAKKIVAVGVAAIITVTAVVYNINLKNNNTVSAKEEALSSSTSTTATSGKTAEYTSIFKKDSVIDIKIEINDKDFENILSNPTAEEYKSANVTVNGTTVKNVGFRAKGNLTLNSVANTDSDRFSFRIKLDKYIKGQNLLGLDEFVVNNMYADPSYMREYLSYEALKSIGADVPEAVFTNLYINGKLYGFYLCVEAIDNSFLQKNFGSDSGSLYKQDKGSTLQYVEGSNYDSSTLNIGKDDTKADLKRFIKILNEMPKGEKGDIESVLDVDSALKYIAANAVLGNYDSYNGNMFQNYYLYGQNSKFTVIPWDYNMSMAGFGGGKLTDISIDEPVLGVNINNLPLIKNLLAVEEYKAKYYDYIKQLLSYLKNFESRVTEVATIIRPYVEKDPSKFYTIEQFEANIKYSETDTSSTGSNTEKANATQNAQNQQNVQNGKDTNNLKPDTNTGASQNTNGNSNKGNQGQKPERMPEGFSKGGGIMGVSTSIVNYIRDRVENINKQLS